MMSITSFLLIFNSYGLEQHKMVDLLLVIRPVQDYPPGSESADYPGFKPKFPDIRIRGFEFRNPAKSAKSADSTLGPIPDNSNPRICRF